MNIMTTLSSRDRSLQQKRVGVFPYLLMLPTIILFTAFVFYPFARTIFLSFYLTNVRGEVVRFMGFGNFVRIFKSSTFINALTNSFKFAGLVGIPSFIIGFVLALLASSQDFMGKAIEIMYSLPMAVAGVAAAAIWRVIMASTSNGLLNWLIGTNMNWFHNRNTALIAVGIVTIWLSIGTNFIFLLTGIRAVPEPLIESATIDGAGYFRRLFRIIIPMASPQIFFVIFLNIVSSFKAFGQIKLLTDGGPNGATSTLIYEIWKAGLVNGRFETACVYSLVLFFIILVITRIQFFFEKRLVNYE